MVVVRQSPGPCSICGADHAVCTSDTGPVTVAQLPARDAMAQTPPEVSASFTTATYKRPKK